MIRRRDDQRREVRERMRGGPGRVTLCHHLMPDDLKAKCRLCAELVIPPGGGIGPHMHEGEDEIFIIRRGSGLMTDDGRETAVGPGDAIVTGNGACHEIRNTGAGDLVLTAIIIRY